MIFSVSRIEGKDLIIRMVLVSVSILLCLLVIKKIIHSQIGIHEIMELQSKTSSIICIQEYVLCL